MAHHLDILCIVHAILIFIIFQFFLFGGPIQAAGGARNLNYLAWRALWRAGGPAGGRRARRGA